MARWGHARPAAEYGRAEGRLVVLGGFAERAEIEREQVVASCPTSITVTVPNRLAPARAVGILQPPSQSPPHPAAVFVEARTSSRIQKVATPMASFALNSRIAGLISLGTPLPRIVCEQLLNIVAQANPASCIVQVSQH